MSSAAAPAVCPEYCKAGDAYVAIHMAGAMFTVELLGDTSVTASLIYQDLRGITGLY